MLQETYPYYLGSEPQTPNTDLDIIDKYTGKVATRVPLADPAAIDKAIGLAVGAEKAMREFPAYARRDVLNHCANRFEERAEELALALCIEAGKPIKDSRGEVTRLIETFRIGAEEATRIYGEVIPMDNTPRAANYTGMWKRVPVGAASFISPFNFPLNLAAHKVAPAIAAGCPFVMKPASATPIGALIIGEVLAETDLPKGAFSILPARRDGADLFTTDDRLKLLSFTGSPGVGWALKAKSGKKKVVLELGGNDGLCGYPIDKIRENLSGMIDAILISGANVLLVGMVLPPNYGRRYTRAFEQLFVQVAAKFNVPFLPFLLEGVATGDALLQRDGMHPTPEAQVLLLDDLWPQLEDLLTPDDSVN
ncbi:MAG: aldehyde dehydrogenase family protein [Myxococcales bacterium]|nr:aldehyde dehydrogenase family protein [Myxococcales bacterium]